MDITEIDIEMRLIRAQVARLAALEPLAYERARKAAGQALGVRLPILDAEVSAARQAAQAAARAAAPDPASPAGLRRAASTRTRGGRP